MPINHVHLTQHALTVAKRRYLLRDMEGNLIETPDQMMMRVAKNVAQAEKTSCEREEWSQKFYKELSCLNFLPNSPTLMNAGTRLQMLSGCFVLPVRDSMPEIFDAVKWQAIVHKSGGGTGFDFSELRPRNTIVGSTKGVASGPISFMRVFDAAVETVKQGGKRRGANMGVLRCDHGDISDFINIKKNKHGFNNFNLSVGITEDFMKNLHNGNDETKIMSQMVRGAWACGDPGILFIDRINQDNPTPQLGRIAATNPCGEVPLLAFESCNLASINIAKFVVDDVIDFNALSNTIQIVVRFLDNVIDMNRYPLPQIDSVTKGNRKIGLGVMGVADALIKLNISYASKNGIDFIDKLAEFIKIKANMASMELAEERGAYANSPDLKFRNACRLSMAPTGSISMIGGCSSGIEPIFALGWVKKVMDNDHLTYINDDFVNAFEGNSHELQAILKRGYVKDPENYETFRVSHQISPEWHLKMQAAWQKHVDLGVSKTINLPNSATENDIWDIYENAWTMGCKGVTVFRDGCLDTQVLNMGT